jgi:hypothetical protein
MQRSSRHAAIPGPSGYPPLGMFLRLWRDPHRCLIEAARRYGEVVSLPLGTTRVYLLAHPTHIQHVLQDQPERYCQITEYSRFGSAADDLLTRLMAMCIGMMAAVTFTSTGSLLANPQRGTHEGKGRQVWRSA